MKCFSNLHESLPGCPFPKPVMDNVGTCRNPMRRTGRLCFAWGKAEFKSDVMKQELARSGVSSLTCPTLTECGLHRCPWARNKGV